MIRYLGIEATRDENRRYVYARITVRENNQNYIQELTDHDFIDEHIHNFARQENCTIYDLINKSWVTITRAYQQPETYGRYGDLFRKDAINPNDYASQRDLARDITVFNRTKDFKRKMIKVGTIGVITIVALTTGINYVVKRHNAYNNKSVRLSYDSAKPMEYDMIKTLSDYEEFDETLQAIVREDSDYLHEKDLTEFFEYLDNLLTTNNDVIQEYQETNRKVKSASYRVDLSHYFPSNSIEENAVFHFQSYINNAVKAITDLDSYSNDYLDYYVSGIIKFVIDPTHGYIYHNDNQGNTAYNINNLSAPARYIILRQAQSILEMQDESVVKYKTYNKDYIMERIASYLKSDVSSIKRIGINYNNKK